MDVIKAKIEAILRDAGVEGEIMLTNPPKAEMGDRAFGCFGLAKVWAINPAEAAQKLRSIIGDGICGQDNILEKVESFGPYVNFFLRAEVLAKLILQKIKKEKNAYGLNTNGGGKKVLIEYPSNNTHKELHVGHLRNMCLGNSLVALFRANGFNIIPVNYINDFGSHVAKCLWGLQKFHAGEKPPANKQKWLGQIYAEASRYLTEHPEEKPAVYKMQTKLEARDKSIWPLFTKTRKWSLDGFVKAFKEMGVRHRRVFYEKDVKDIGQQTVDELLKKKIATVGEGGAIIVDLSSYDLDVALLRKSNGSGLYLTSDFGLAVIKNKKYSGVSESLHLTGTEQNFYFQQLFKLLELAGYNYKMTHIGYGLVSCAEGKMSSRLGNVILYDEVRDDVLRKVMDETAARHPNWSAKKIRAVATAVAFAAIKFDFLKHEAAKTVVFDAQSAASFDGFTGPYILYTVARINSIEKKMKRTRNKINYRLLIAPEEKNLLLMISQFSEVVEKAWQNYNPSVMAKYSFDLAKMYNDFYNKLSVLKAENTELAKARLALSLAARTVLTSALALLSIETAKEM